MKPMRLSAKDAKAVTDVLSGKIKYVQRSKPLTEAERAELAEMQADPDAHRDAFGRWLESGNDFLSRFKAEQTKE